MYITPSLTQPPSVGVSVNSDGYSLKMLAVSTNEVQATEDLSNVTLSYIFIFKLVVFSAATYAVVHHKTCK